MNKFRLNNGKLEQICDFTHEVISNIQLLKFPKHCSFVTKSEEAIKN